MTNDEILYCRILRYEPINVDDLLAKVETTGIQSKQLRLKLRAYLDASGVNHYGDSTRNR